MLAPLADCTAAFPFGDAYTRLALVEVMVTNAVHVVLVVTYWLVDVSTCINTEVREVVFISEISQKASDLLSRQLTGWI